MSLTPSAMMPLGTMAPAFSLTNTVSGKVLTLPALKGGKATVVMFICNHCPYVKHVLKELVRAARDYQPKGVAFIAISSNDAVNYPEDAPARMTEVARDLKFPFPYLYDETQDVARAYHAACTPDFFLFDAAPSASAGDNSSSSMTKSRTELQDVTGTPAAALACVYRGQFDGSRPGNGVPVSGVDLRAALDAMLTGRPVNPDQKPSVGCNIKWK